MSRRQLIRALTHNARSRITEANAFGRFKGCGCARCAHRLQFNARMRRLALEAASSYAMAVNMLGGVK